MSHDASPCITSGAHTPHSVAHPLSTTSETNLPSRHPFARSNIPSGQGSLHEQHQKRYPQPLFFDVPIFFPIILCRLDLVGRAGLLLVAALLQLGPRPHSALSVRDETELRETVDDHLGGVELGAHAELGRRVVEGVLVVPKK